MACPVCGERLFYNFITRKGAEGDGYYLFGHDRLPVDRDFVFTMDLEKAQVQQWRGFDGRKTVEAIEAWCHHIHAITADPTFVEMCLAVIKDAYKHGGGPFGQEVPA